MTRRCLVILPAIVAALAAVGCGGAEPTRQASNGDLPRGGRYVDVDGHRVFIRCTGDGTPTVVLEAGAGLESSDWAPIQREVDDETRVCSYDRPGLGRSETLRPENGESQLSDDEVAKHLHDVLEEADVEPPYVLVGHSMGGLYVRQYAAEHLADVAGMVLVDTVSGAETELGDRPLVVLTAGDGWSTGDHAKFARLSTNSIHVVAEKSGHFIEQDQPGLVAEAIRRVVASARMDSGLPPCADVFPELDGECLSTDG